MPMAEEHSLERQKWGNNIKSKAQHLYSTLFSSFSVFNTCIVAVGRTFLSVVVLEIG